MVHHNAQAGGIVLSRLSKSYGQVRAVRSIDLTIAPGETVALLGPNGAGKTTTIDLMVGLTRPDAGTVSVFGRRPRIAGPATAWPRPATSPASPSRGLGAAPIWQTDRRQS